MEEIINIRDVFKIAIAFSNTILKWSPRPSNGVLEIWKDTFELEQWTNRNREFTQ